MAKTIYLLYQDCPMCGQRKNWGERQLEIADTLGFDIVKVSFASANGRKLIGKAFNTGQLKALPLFTDGEKFSKDLHDFIYSVEKKPKTMKKTTRRRKKVEEKVENNGDSE